MDTSLPESFQFGLSLARRPIKYAFFFQTCVGAVLTSCVSVLLTSSGLNRTNSIESTLPDMKPTSDGTHRLTESNLERHEQLLERQELNIRTIPWVDKVIKEEQIHQFYSQSGRQFSEMPPVSPQTVADLKLFEQQQGVCLEGPLKRYLTPGGCGGPNHYIRAALREMGFSFGSMDGREERKQVAQQGVDAVAKRKVKERTVES